MIYLRSISVWPQTWDTGEMQVVPYILGIAHPTGFPFFMLLGWLFSHAVPFASVAWRMNLLCAIFMAGSAATVRLLALSFGAAQLPALLGSIIFALTAVSWNKASHSNVHTLALLFSLLCLFAAMRFATTRVRGWLICGAAAFGLGLATHPNVLWSGIALLPWFVVVARSNVKLAIVLLALAILPLSIYAYLPLRSAVVEATGADPAAKPPFNWHGEVAWDTNRPSTTTGFITEVSGSQFGAARTLRALWDIAAYPRYLKQWYTEASKQLTPVTIWLAALGLYALFVAPIKRRLGSLLVLCGGFAAIPFAYSYGAEGDVSRYLLPSLAVTSAMAATASEAAPGGRYAARLVLAAVMLLVVKSLYVANNWEYGARSDLGGQPVIDEMRAQIPNGAVVLSNWIDGTALAYGAYVDRSLGRRVVLLWSGGDVKYYIVWAKRYRVFALANFAIISEVRSVVPPACLRQLPPPDKSHELFEIRCPTFQKSAASPHR